MSAPRHWHFAAVPLAVGLAIGLDRAEIAVRIFGLAPALPEQYSAFAPDAVLPWKPAPYRIEEGKPAINPSLPLRAAIGWGFVAISPIFACR